MPNEDRFQESLHEVVGRLSDIANDFLGALAGRVDVAGANGPLIDLADRVGQSLHVVLDHASTAATTLSERLREQISQLPPEAQEDMRLIFEQMGLDETFGSNPFTDAAAASAMPDVQALLADPLGAGLRLLLERAVAEDAPLRVPARIALRKITDPKAVPAFVAQLKDRRWEIRDICVDALARIGDVSAVEPLIERLKDPDWRVRKKAARALGPFGDVRAVPALRQIVDQGPEELRAIAEDALEEIRFYATNGREPQVRVRTRVEEALEGYLTGREPGRGTGPIEEG